MLSRSFECIFVVSLAAGFLTFTYSANACSCGPRPTVLDSYDGSDVVVIARATSVEKVGPDKTAPKGHIATGRDYVDGVRSTTMRVEQVFKGNLKVGDQMIFAQGGGADCIWTFSEESVDKKFLFYLNTLKDSRGVWIAITCGRSNRVDYAADDLLYLENLSKLQGKTRLSGTLAFYQLPAVEDQEPIYKVLAGKSVRVIGPQKTYTLATNKNGVYEIYDIPPGNYIVEPEIPLGWKLDRFMSIGTFDAPKDTRASTENNPKARKPQVTVRAGKHAYFDFDYEVDNVIAGTLFDPQGRPMNNVCLHLLPAHGKKAQYFYKSDCTEDGGRFSIDDIPSGEYVLVINEGGKISSDEPFPTFYYPNVFERERAAVITIGEGEKIEDLKIQVPSIQEMIVVEGVLLYSDGKPVADELVEFKSEGAESGIDGDARAKTDATGKFSIRLLKNLHGELYSDMFVYSSEFENCPKLERLIKATGDSHTTLKTNAVKISSDVNVFAVELRLPFPYCKKSPD